MKETLHVIITVDTTQYTFQGTGDPAAVVAAFRLWLSQVNQTPALQADPVITEKAGAYVPQTPRLQKHLMDEAFSVPGWHRLDRIVECTKSLLVTVHDVQQALSHLTVAEQIEARTLGPHREYRRRP